MFKGNGFQDVVRTREAAATSQIRIYTRWRSEPSEIPFFWRLYPKDRTRPGGSHSRAGGRPATTFFIILGLPPPSSLAMG